MSEMNAQTVALVTEKLRQASENTTKMINYGIESGKALAEDAFWNAIQGGGERTDYQYVFSDTVWGTEFNPKYSFNNMTNALYMFRNAKVGDRLYTDKLDFSNCTSMLGTFIDSDVACLKRVDMRSCLASANGANSTFNTCRSLREITEFYPPVDAKMNYSFANCSSLETLIVYSEISSNFDVRWSKKLSRVSIESIIYHLKLEVSGLTITLSKDAVNKAFETSEGANNGVNNSNWCDDLAGYAESLGWSVVLY